MAQFRGDFLTLAELAEADAKRDGRSPTAFNLARALAGRDQEGFEAVFGAGSATRVRSGELAPSASPPSVETVLSAAKDSDTTSVAEQLRKALGELPEWIIESAGEPDGLPQTGPEESPNEGSHPLLDETAPGTVAASLEAPIQEILAQFTRRIPGNPLLLAPGGAGKTAVAGGLAARLEAGELPDALRDSRIIRLAVDRLLAGDVVSNFSVALNALEPNDIAFVDDLEALLGLPSGGFIGPLAMRLRVALEQPQTRIVSVLDSAYFARLEAADPDLLSEFVQLKIDELPREEVAEIAARQGRELAAHHGVELPNPVIDLAMAPPAHESQRIHPGIAVDRIDLACARAALREDHKVAESDLGFESNPEVGPLQAETLGKKLREDVRGQDTALERVVRRLALTRARLDLRPERPDGVLLFIGPTGVGKTQLAKSLCRELFGDEQRLIRLDMSEYSESWAVARLIGPQPGFVGYTEPDAWLTTRVRREPRTVLLLDEIEKAHPTVWNTFLQVFDAGRLTDPRGNVADFGEVVIVMTSNIGSADFDAPAFGFAPREEEAQRTQAEERVMGAVRETLSPELLNRLDEVIVFSTLDEASILEIASRELEAAVSRLAERGYNLTVEKGVAKLVAETGYDPRYGARHLQRNLERLVLMPMAGLSSRQLHAEVRDGAVEWSETVSKSKKKERT